MQQLEQDVRLLTDRNNDFASQNHDVNLELQELREYAAERKHKEELATFGHQTGWITEKGQLNKTVPYRKPEIYKSGENIWKWLK